MKDMLKIGIPSLAIKKRRRIKAAVVYGNEICNRTGGLSFSESRVKGTRGGDASTFAPLPRRYPPRQIERKILRSNAGDTEVNSTGLEPFPLERSPKHNDPSSNS